MSNSIFHVRPLDGGIGWAIDEYDGRGAWQHSVPIGPDGAPMDKQQAQRAVFQLRRKAVNSAKPSAPVNRKVSASGAWWIHCDIDGSGARWRLAVERGGEVYFPMEDFGEEMTVEQYREEFPLNEMTPAGLPAARAGTVRRHECGIGYCPECRK